MWTSGAALEKAKRQKKKKKKYVNINNNNIHVFNPEDSQIL